MKNVFRFRKIENLLGKYSELTTQEIYFASPSELNDPLEGMMKVFWKGDEILWSNFFYNYIRSLEDTFFQSAVLNRPSEIKSEDIVLAPFRAQELPQLRIQILDEIKSEIFNDKPFKKFISSISKRSTNIGKNELLSYLSNYQLFFLGKISKQYYNKGLITKQIPSESKFEDAFPYEIKGKTYPDFLENMINETKSKNSIESFLSFAILCSNHALVKTQIDLLRKSNQKLGIALLITFPELYLNKLELSIYPKWFSASFLNDYSDSSIWSHYANNHQGVCLEFQSYNTEGTNFMNFWGEIGVNQDGPLVGNKEMKLYNVNYTSTPSEIDFFDSFGRLAKFESQHFWYTFNKNKSSRVPSYDNTESEWQKKYWDLFYESISNKTSHWNKEIESRLIMNDMTTDLSENSNRKLEYYFKDLVSITFGIKTASKDKFEIIEIIRNKCSEHNREDFIFYQAYYCTQTSQIKRFKIDSIKSSV